jgi:hypothetical protein
MKVFGRLKVVLRKHYCSEEYSLNKRGNILAILLLVVGSGWFLLLMTGVLRRAVDRMASFIPLWMSIPIVVLLPLSYALLTINLEINWKIRLLFGLSLVVSCSFLPAVERTHSAASLIALGFTYLEMLWLMPKINKRLADVVG